MSKMDADALTPPAGRTHTQRTIPFLAALAALAAACCHAQAPSARPPNVLVILADDLGFSDIGCYGSEIATPHLDSLAGNGLRFTQCYNTARCWPTRCALVTGYYPQQLHQDPRKGRFPAWTRTLAHLLKPLGYRAYHSGKWHVTGAPRPVADGGFDRSYDLEDHDRNFYPKRHLEDDRPLPPVDPQSGYYSSTAFADHAIRRHKTWVHEGGIATPLVVHWPAGIAARGEWRRDLCHLIDIVPTALAAAGAPVAPPPGAPPFPGLSLLPAFSRDGAVTREALYFSHEGNRALRMGDFKLVSAKRDGDAWSLYDLARDRGEQQDLAVQQPERVRAMAVRWQALDDAFARDAGEVVPLKKPPPGKKRE